MWGPIRLEPPPIDPESGICDSEKRITGNQKEEWEGYEEDIPLSPFPSCAKIPPMFSYHSSLLPTIPDTLIWYTDTWFQSSQNLLCNIKLFNKNCSAKNSYFATKIWHFCCECREKHNIRISRIKFWENLQMRTSCKLCNPVSNIMLSTLLPSLFRTSGFSKSSCLDYYSVGLVLLEDTILISNTYQNNHLECKCIGYNFQRYYWT